MHCGLPRKDGMLMDSTFLLSESKSRRRRRKSVDCSLKPRHAVRRFRLGKEKWDLILFFYFFPQAVLPKVWEALRRGLIPVKGFTSRPRESGPSEEDIKSDE